MNNQMQFKYDRKLPPDAVLELYYDAGWSAYTQDPPKLQRALRNSIALVSAWENSQLLGLVRAVGDAETILYVQDILVLQSHRRRGLGRELLRRLLEQFADVRQVVLLTDDTPVTRAFYAALNFRSCDDSKLVAFAKLANA